MQGSRTNVFILLGLLSAFLHTGTVTAQIYKWVDDEGNVHFGDKPLDPAKAQAAESVELQRSYTPAERTAEEQTNLEAQQEINRRRTEARQREREAANDERKVAAKARAQETAERCAELKEKLRRLSGITVDENGRRIRTYATENGKSVSVQRQREITEEIEAELSESGCET